jgi:dihydropteroate synthase
VPAARDGGAGSPVRPLVMGIVNVTPDSFSDGGRYLSVDAAVAHGLTLVAEGADIVDVGGESSRPGAEPVPAAEERRRVVPVIEALAPHVRVSVDTTKPDVARAAVDAGATLINDVSASLDAVAAETGVGWVAMHRQGTPQTMQMEPHYDDVVAEVAAFLAERAAAARDRGVAEVWVDPGIGFGKTAAHNLSILRHLDHLVALGWPVVVGTSRKATLGRVLAASDQRGRVELGPGQQALGALDTATGSADALAPTAVDDRLEASVATATWALQQGAGMVRVHDVLATVQAAKVVAG